MYCFAAITWGAEVCNSAVIKGFIIALDKNIPTKIKRGLAQTLNISCTHTQVSSYGQWPMGGKESLITQSSFPLHAPACKPIG